MRNVNRSLLLLVLAVQAGCAGFSWTRPAQSDAPPSQTERRAPDEDYEDVEQAWQADADQAERPLAASRSESGASSMAMLEALESLKRRDPLRYAALSAALAEADGQLSPADQRFLLDQALALARSQPDSLEARSARAEVTDQLGTSSTSEPQLETAAIPGPARSDVAIEPAPATIVPAEATGGRQQAAQRDPVEPLAIVDASAIGTSTTATPEAGGRDIERQGAVQAVSHQEPAGVGDLPTAQKGAPTEPEPDWRAALQQATERLQQELRDPAADPSTLARHQAYLRLLYVIADRQQEAVAPIEELGTDEQEYWKHILYSLLVTLDADERHADSRRAALALRDLRRATDYLAHVSTLDLRNLAFCKQVASFGSYEEFKLYTFRPGAEVLLYVEIENFAVQERGEEYETELRGEYVILSGDGERLASVVLPLDKQICKNRRRDYFIAYRLFLPDPLPAGDYTLVLTMEDVKGKKSNQASLNFRIR